MTTKILYVVSDKGLHYLPLIHKFLDTLVGSQMDLLKKFTGVVRTKDI